MPSVRCRILQLLAVLAPCLVLLNWETLAVGFLNMSFKVFPETQLTLKENTDPPIYRDRREQMLSACSKVNSTLLEHDRDSHFKDNLLVDRTNKLLFCIIEKIGCTFWKRVFRISTGKSRQMNPFDIPPADAHKGGLDSFASLRLRESMALSFKRIIFVREPYSRLFSGYIDKLFSPQPELFWLRRKVAKLTRSQSDVSSAGCAPRVTFAEFSKFVINSVLTGQDKNPHFSPMYQHCHPCALGYDIIGKMETFSSDAEYVIKSQNLSRVIDVNFHDQSRNKDAIRDVLRHAYEGRAGIIKCMNFTEALKLTWKELQIRGFIEKTISLPSKFLTNQNLTFEDMEMASLEAHSRSDPVKRRANRREALIEAIRTLDPETVTMFRKLFLQDFKVFGYDIAPSDIFSDNSVPSRYSYFSL